MIVSPSKRWVGIIFANEDCSLAVVGDGDSALAAIRSERPDLIMADVVMPGKNGYELCAAVKTGSRLAGRPCIVAYRDLLSRLMKPAPVLAGVDDWIVKPFESQALLDKVAELLAKVPEPAVSEAPLSDLEDDFDIVEDFVEPLGADADMWQELPEPSLGVPAAETILGEQPSLPEATTGDFDEPFFDGTASSPEPVIPSAVEEIADSFESPMPDPVSEVGHRVPCRMRRNYPLRWIPGGEAAVESAEGDLWLDAADADEVLFLDEDDILDEDLLAEDLAAERTADLSFDSGTDVFSPEVDSVTPLPDSVLDVATVAEEPVVVTGC